MKYSDIPQFKTYNPHYNIQVELLYFDETINEFEKEYDLILNPDFQRGHVWTEKQQKEYVEYFLQGGMSGRDIYFNSPSWFKKAQTNYNEFVCVDGLQRITALRKFWNNKLKVFGYYRSEIEGSPRGFQWMNIHVNDLQTKEDVLRWYIQINSSGTPHSEEEINRIKELLKREIDNNK